MQSGSTVSLTEMALAGNQNSGLIILNGRYIFISHSFDEKAVIVDTVVIVQL